jgi:transcriptional regulator with PAS, ATPase and Fis domain
MPDELIKNLAGDFFASIAPDGIRQIDQLFEHLKFDSPAKSEVNFSLSMPPEMRRKILQDIGIKASDLTELSQRYMPYLIILNKLINRYRNKLNSIEKEEIAGFIWQEGRRIRLFEHEIQQLIDTIPDWLQKIARKCSVEFSPANICAVESGKTTDDSDQNSEISFEGIIGTSEKMRSMFKCLKKISASNLSILIQGESGTGKELVAHAIHSLSSHSGNNFIPVNCGALPDSIIESELFGYEKGAFTGADFQKKGYFEIADQGTIFLDEITETSLNTQVKLLRVLQEKQFYRVGGTKPVKVNARIITATNQDILDLVKDGSFRHDLYYRINEMTIKLPPLRERKSDLSLLTSHFIKSFAKQNNKPVPALTAESKALLENYNWPGNIRELENALKRAVVLADDVIYSEHFPEIIREPGNNSFKAPSNKNNHPESLKGTLEDRVTTAEKAIITAELKKQDFNVSKTAEILNVSRRTLQRKIKQYSIKKP